MGGDRKRDEEHDDQSSENARDRTAHGGGKGITPGRKKQKNAYIIPCRMALTLVNETEGSRRLVLFYDFRRETAGLWIGSAG